MIDNLKDNYWGPNVGPRNHPVYMYLFKVRFMACISYWNVNMHATVVNTLANEAFHPKI
jgi:hypothetical protein